MYINIYIHMWYMCCMQISPYHGFQPNHTPIHPSNIFKQFDVQCMLHYTTPCLKPRVGFKTTTHSTYYLFKVHDKRPLVLYETVPFPLTAGRPVLSRHHRLRVVLHLSEPWPRSNVTLETLQMLERNPTWCRHHFPYSICIADMGWPNFFKDKFGHVQIATYKNKRFCWWCCAGTLDFLHKASLRQNNAKGMKNLGSAFILDHPSLHKPEKAGSTN